MHLNILKAFSVIILGHYVVLTLVVNCIYTIYESTTKLSGVYSFNIITLFAPVARCGAVKTKLLII